MQTRIPNCLCAVINGEEKCSSGFRRITLLLSESDECRGVFYHDLFLDETYSRITPARDTITVDIPEVDIRRWEAIFARPPAKVDVKNLAGGLSDRVRNFPRLEGVWNGMALYVGLAVTGLIYGGLHCLAWNAPFTTKTEALLWRLSSIAIMLTFALVLLFYVWNLSPRFWVDFSDWRHKTGGFPLVVLYPVIWLILWLPDPWEDWAVNILVIPVLWVGLLVRAIYDVVVVAAVVLYCVARVYLVVECFISLAHLPASVFEVLVWSQYVPHIS